MGYSKTTWQDRIVEKPLTYQLTDNGDGTFTLVPAPGTITQAGTAVNAARLNNLETQYDAVKAELAESGTSDIRVDANNIDNSAGSGLDADLYQGLQWVNASDDILFESLSEVTGTAGGTTFNTVKKILLPKPGRYRVTGELKSGAYTVEARVTLPGDIAISSTASVTSTTYSAFSLDLSVPVGFMTVVAVQVRITSSSGGYSPYLRNLRIKGAVGAAGTVSYQNL